MGWLWTALFSILFTLLMMHINALERTGDPHADQWYWAIGGLVILFLVVAYKKSAKV